jgi:NodT family efflux transporter outer membrane factor (OMF) lipoprotein
MGDALTRVREARAHRATVAAERFPTISAAMRTRGDEEPSADPVNELHSPRFDASWELAVFGGPRRAAEATEAELEAGVDDMRDALVTLFAEVALNYVEVRSLQRRLALADEHIRSQSEIYVITRWRQLAGLTSKRELERARLSLDETRTEIPELAAHLERARHRLAVLLNQPPDELVPELTAAKAVPSARVDLAVGVPADVLRRRPDVRRAERELAAQVGASIAARSPSFPLVGSIGLETLAPGRWLSSAAMSSLTGGNANGTFFDADSIRQNIEVQTAPQEQALTDYEVAVITALQEVEDALVAFAKEQARRESLERATQSAKTTAELANKRYIAGSIGFQAILDAQRSLRSLQDKLATSEGEAATHLIRLYKALGGGWAPDPVTAPPVAREPALARQ